MRSLYPDVYKRQIISGVLNKKITYSPRMVAENLVLVAVFFLVLIVLSRLFTKMMRLLPGEVNSYRLMMIFPNLGFMGIPLVRLALIHISYIRC